LLTDIGNEVLWPETDGQLHHANFTEDVLQIFAAKHEALEFRI
jgi:hypothetical protein